MMVKNILTVVFSYENRVYKSYFSNHQLIVIQLIVIGMFPCEGVVLLLDKEEGGGG